MCRLLSAISGFPESATPARVADFGRIRMISHSLRIVYQDVCAPFIRWRLIAIPVGRRFTQRGSFLASAFQLIPYVEGNSLAA
jgi:hypothetical protein